jgi:hypothetical protein
MVSAITVQLQRSGRNALSIILRSSRLDRVHAIIGDILQGGACHPLRSRSPDFLLGTCVNKNVHPDSSHHLRVIGEHSKLYAWPQLEAMLHLPWGAIAKTKSAGHEKTFHQR